MSRAKALLVSAATLLFARRRRAALKPGERERIVVPEPPAAYDAELAAIWLFLASAACAIAFIVVYALDRLPAHTQLLGLALGLSLAFLAAGLVVMAKRLVPNEELEEDYPEQEHTAEQARIARVVGESAPPRRRLLLGAPGPAGGSLGLALLAPPPSLGPAIPLARFSLPPWRRGPRLV